MAQSDRGSATPIIAVLVLFALLGAATGILNWLTQRRMGREVAAELSLRTLSFAEADYRSNDRDGNGILDFWTGDVAGLYRYGLITIGMAQADAAPLVPLVPQPTPYKGYYLKALVADESGTPPVPYCQTTDKASGAVHHLQRFGFVAYPAPGLAPAKYMWIINENNTAFRASVNVPVPSNWPSDAQLKNFWSKVD